MTLEEIKELIQLVMDSGVAELEVERGGNKVRILRTHATSSEVVLAGHAGAASQPVAAPLAVAAGVSGAAAAAPDPMKDPSLFLQKAPIVGTFYEAPKPDAPPFVRVGDYVQKGKVLCIIESMKLMNEIEAEEAGVIVAKLVENEHPVEYGEALFAMKPA
jgi:acetyl-CoA carboxylase biotin carboxyl carrier protein